MEYVFASPEDRCMQHTQLHNAIAALRGEWLVSCEAKELSLYAMLERGALHRLALLACAFIEHII